jgi:uncharacterized protein YkwD
MAMMAVVLIAVPSSAGASAKTASVAAEAAMVEAINEVRASHGLHTLRKSSSLTDSAGRFARWLMDNDTFRHLSRIRASSRFSTVGEALAWHAGHSYGVRGTLDQWMASPPHRALVLSPAMQWAGTGVTRGRMGTRLATLWVLHVGTLRAQGGERSRLSLP